MRYALIDDATLESAKRMEGIIPGNNTVEVAGDILALENLIQAILFCDEIFYLELKGNKKKSNGKAFEGFRQVCLNDDAYSELLDAANKMTDNYLPCIEGGLFTDDCFKSFFRSLDMEIRFVWEKKGDIFYLTPRIIRSSSYVNGLLYRKLLSMILNELTDKSFLTQVDPRPPLLYDSEGQIINNCYQVMDKSGKYLPSELSPQAEALFKAANYMAYRCNLHLLAARELKADLVLSPIRTSFQRCCYNHFCLGNLDSGGSIRPEVTIREIPMFTFWIAEHMKADSGFIKAAYELREESEFKSIRRFLNDQSNKADSSAYDGKPGMEAGLNGQFEQLVKKFRVSPEKGVASASFQMIGYPETHARLPELSKFSFGLRPQQPEIDPAKNDRRHFGVIYRAVHDDLIRMDEMNEYFDTATVRIKYKADDVLQNIKVETKGSGAPHTRV